MKTPKDSTGLKIKEVIVVEGRDDTSRIKETLVADTFETGGYGYSPQMLKTLDEIYEDRGLIIFTDPDYAGKKIRKDLKKRYPKAKEAFVSVKDANKKGDLGIENVSPELIRQAIEKASPEYIKVVEKYKNIDMVKYGLTGLPNSKEKRDRLCQIFNLRKGNTRVFIEELNSKEIKREDLERELAKIE